MSRWYYWCCWYCLLISCSHDAERYTVKGIDVSHYQQRIDWELLAEEKEVDFVFIKATEGVNYKDSTFQRNWLGVGKIGLKRGAYHFFKPRMSVEWQIKNFTQQVQLQKGDLPPVLDVEDIKNVSMPVLIDKVGKWLMFIEEHYQVRPILYASLDLYQHHLRDAFPDYPVWIARYNRVEPPTNLQWMFWQYSDRARVKGIPEKVDRNVFIGTIKELNALGL